MDKHTSTKSPGKRTSGAAPARSGQRLVLPAIPLPNEKRRAAKQAAADAAVSASPASPVARSGIRDEDAAATGDMEEGEAQGSVSVSSVTSPQRQDGSSGEYRH